MVFGINVRSENDVEDRRVAAAVHSSAGGRRFRFVQVLLPVVPKRTTWNATRCSASRAASNTRHQAD